LIGVVNGTAAAFFFVFINLQYNYRISYEAIFGLDAGHPANWHQEI
jgi:hypothetical protein